MRIQNIDLFFYSLLWMFLMFITIQVTDGKLGLNSPNMPKEIIQKVEHAKYNTKNARDEYINLLILESKMV